MHQGCVAADRQCFQGGTPMVAGTAAAKDVEGFNGG
jgi:hypothetical protein